MKHLFAFLSLALSLTAMSQNYNWYKPTEPVAQLSPSPPVCGMNEGCYWSEQDRLNAVHSFMNCMAEKQSVIIDENQFDYTDNDFGRLGILHCWGYAHLPQTNIPGSLYMSISKIRTQCGFSSAGEADAAMQAEMEQTKKMYIIDEGSQKVTDHQADGSGAMEFCFSYSYHL